MTFLDPYFIGGAAIFLACCGLYGLYKFVVWFEHNIDKKNEREIKEKGNQIN